MDYFVNNFNNFFKILSQFFTSYYQGIMMFCSAVISELFSIHIFEDREEKGLKRIQNNLFGLVIKIIIAAFVFFLALFLASLLQILIKSIGQKQFLKNEFIVTLRTLVSINMGELWTMFIAVPIVSTISGVLLKKNKLRRWALIIMLLIVMVTGPFLTDYRSDNSGLQEIIIEGCHRIPFPYVTRLYDPDGFYSKCRKGYGDFPYDQTGSGDRNEVTKPDTLDTSDFDSLMKNVNYYHNYGSHSEAQYYLELAYEIYEKDPGAIDISFNLGMMWYCKGYYVHKLENYEQSAVFYANAGDVFIQLNQDGNSILCYGRSYEDVSSHETADTIIQVLMNSSDSTLDDRKDIIEEILLIMQKSYPDSIPVLQRLADIFPDSLPVQTVNVLRHIGEDNVSNLDLQIIEKFLSRDRYASCPKLQITRAYLKMLSGQAVEMQGTYDLYEKHPDYFEPEDKIHLAWISYKERNYGRACYYIVEGYRKADKDNTNDSMNALSSQLVFSDDIVISAEAPLKMEIYLQDPDRYVRTNAKKLNKKYLSVYEELSPWYNKEARLRFSIMSLLLSQERGYSKQISEQAVQLFDSDSFYNKIMDARVSYEKGRYKECCKKCEIIIDTDSLSGTQRNQVLFLQADAFIARAKKATKENKREEFYKGAEAAMNEIRKNIEPDYLESLKRLKTIYTGMGKEYLKDAEEINSILSVFEN